MPFYYAVARGRKPGIYQSWPECNDQVQGFTNARYKKFKTEAEAQEFIKQNSSTSSNSTPYQQQQRGTKRKFSSTGSDNKEYISAKLARIEVDSSTTVVYTDGACSANGRKHAVAGVGVYWGDNHVDNVSEPLLLGPQTNNRAEYQAVFRALEIAKLREYKVLQVRTDSNLLVRSMNEWMPKWKRNGWKTQSGEGVKNRDLLEKIDQLRQHVNVSFVHVDGHAGIHGNEKADELARQGVGRNNVKS